jgi:DNA uptake protein ComE-like DNA-binding protein
MKSLPGGDLFAFSKRERRGIYVLLALLALALIFRLYLPALLPPAAPLPDEASFLEEVEAWIDSSRRISLDSSREKSRKAKALRQLPPPFDFNPNQVTPAQMERLGFTPQQIHTLVRYRQKGGRFKTPNDLTRIYGMDEPTYRRLKDHIVIPVAVSPVRPKPDSSGGTYRPPTLCLNEADTFQFTLLPGIGPVYARRICKYRNLLGGFVSTGQLAEVYGLDTPMVRQLAPYLVVDSPMVRKINLNDATFSQLVRHPYLNAYQARALLNYRRFRGNISHPFELQKNNILDSITYIKMEPYIEVGH